MQRGSNFCCAPVLMLGFNRPERTRASLAAVRLARPSRLYIAVDGPRAGRSDDEAMTREVREVVGLVDWPCRVKTLFRERNLGCARGISEAITWFFAQEPYGIILEDDVVPSPGFFRYESELLERYKDDSRIGLVSGFNHYGFQTDRTASYHFTNRADIWGWGSWARVWRDYSLDIRPIKADLDMHLARFTDNRRMRTMLRSYVNGVAVEIPDTWDVQFSLLCLVKGYLAIEPRKRLTGNVGFEDLRGSHTQGYNYDAVHYCDVWEGECPLVHPVSGVCLDRNAVLLTERRMCGILPRGLTFLGSVVRNLRPMLNVVGCAMEKMTPALFRI